MSRRILGARRGTNKKRRGTANWKQAEWKRSPFCHYCGARFKSAAEATVDHKRPLVKGGYSKRTNYVLACRPCNAKKGAMPYDSFIATLVEQAIS